MKSYLFTVLQVVGFVGINHMVKAYPESYWVNYAAYLSLLWGSGYLAKCIVVNKVQQNGPCDEKTRSWDDRKFISDTIQAGLIVAVLTTSSIDFKLLLDDVKKKNKPGVEATHPDPGNKRLQPAKNIIKPTEPEVDFYVRDENGILTPHYKHR